MVKEPAPGPGRNFFSPGKPGAGTFWNEMVLANGFEVKFRIGRCQPSAGFRPARAVVKNRSWQPESFCNLLKIFVDTAGNCHYYY
jgi:hypothetical protein